MLYTERCLKRLILRLPRGERRVVLSSLKNMFAAGETGLLAVEKAPDYARTHDFITCHGHRSGSRQDVRVVRWHLTSSGTRGLPRSGAPSSRGCGRPQDATARRAEGRIWSVEQGSYRVDEVNLLRKGGNYGWNP